MLCVLFNTICHLDILLQPSKNPTPEKIIPLKAKSVSPSPGKTSEKKKTDNDNAVDNGTFFASNIKMDYAERDAEGLLILFLYVKSINKEKCDVSFTEDSISATFSTRCV